MLTSKINKTTEIINKNKLPFPKLMISNTSGRIILATRQMSNDEIKGYVVYAPTSVDILECDCWDANYFVDFYGELTLIQK